MKRITLAVAFMASMALHGATLEEARRIVNERFDLYKRTRGLRYDSPEKKRHTQVWQEERDLGYDAFPVYYEMLEEHFDDPCLVSQIMFEFIAADGENLASEGKREALEWARKVEKAYVGKPFEALGIPLAYLTLKGDAGDLDLFYDKESAALLAARVAGTNVTSLGSHKILYVRPSVTNTGPQGVYVYEIIKRAWEGMDKGTSVFIEDVREYLANLPPELLTLVVSFDGDGNPVCNVDLAEYGLSMPVIEPKPTSTDIRGMGRTVTFPHDSDGRVPPQATPGTDPPPQPPDVTDAPPEEPPPDPPLPTEVEQPEDTPVENTTAPWRLPLLIAVLTLGGTVALWRYLRKKGKS